jgi:hypothetical protein
MMDVHQAAKAMKNAEIEAEIESERKRSGGRRARYRERHRQLVASGQLNLRPGNRLRIYCQPTVQISAKILNFWVLEALCSAAVT